MDTERVRFIDMVAFVCEVATFVLLVVAVNALIDGGRSWLISIPVAIALALVWARWIAPTAERRLDDPHRYFAQAAIFLAVGAAAVIAGLLWWAVVCTVASLAAFALTRSDRMI